MQVEFILNSSINKLAGTCTLHLLVLTIFYHSSCMYLLKCPAAQLGSTLSSVNKYECYKLGSLLISLRFITKMVESTSVTPEKDEQLSSYIVWNEGFCISTTFLQFRKQYIFTLLPVQWGLLYIYHFSPI